MFKWKDAYSCNIAEIDSQHKRLFELGEKVYDIVSIKDGFDHYDEIMSSLFELQKYAIYHFDFEEKLMKNNGYEEYDSHVKKHREFFDKILELSKKDIDENQHKVSMDILVFIADWIENHILKTDTKYKNYLNSKGIY
ncbi:bacteriohemerythrin [Clostridium homopropionicum DSM 5847]|uniref:Bacteriohemerythrin n=1 Tax=Clostridium homopropionicum DSM 5847 TaxID=1121318 RepID=A0A0L6ZE70_9CLOT|nr:bacteriohemerythrin [Clostridium homopropionicum]KOA21279.1 bacteriohemerythrin [Clostridium homopropionicum DSM 5847]SFG29724.1 hemerythrin [Clostridium homopropionicum]